MGETIDSARAKAVTSTIVEVVKEGAIKAAQTAAPYLAAPVIKQVFEFLVDRFASLFEAELGQYAANFVIEAKNNSNAQAANEAAIKLKHVVADPTQPQAAVDAAKQEFKDALKKLIRIRPATS